MNRKLLPPTLLFLAAFLIVLLARLPLRWALPLLPGTLHCEAPAGSLWDGHCGSLSARGSRGSFLLLGSAGWHLRPARLLRARIALDVSLVRGPSRASGLLQFGLHSIEVLDLAARGPLDPTLMPGFPPTWTGELEIIGARARLNSGQLTALDGTAVARDLTATSPRHTVYGSYQLRIPRVAGGGLAAGEITDQGGPLQLQATLRLTPKLEWQLEGKVAPRATADPEVAREIQSLGSPDSQGLRPFSVAGNF